MPHCCCWDPSQDHSWQHHPGPPASFTLAAGSLVGRLHQWLGQLHAPLCTPSFGSTLPSLKSRMLNGQGYGLGVRGTPGSHLGFLLLLVSCVFLSEWVYSSGTLKIASTKFVVKIQLGMGCVSCSDCSINVGSQWYRLEISSYKRPWQRISDNPIRYFMEREELNTEGP